MVEPTGHRKDPEKMGFACRIPKARIQTHACNA